VLFEGARPLHGEVLARRFQGRRVIRLWTEDGSPVEAAVDAIGHVPLPPYIKRPDRLDDRGRYQTVFARERGSVAAPTAGLHVSAPLLTTLATRGVEVVEITLHVGYGTFQPVRVDRVEAHRRCRALRDWSGTAAKVNQALDERRRIVAVGTTRRARSRRLPWPMTAVWSPAAGPRTCSSIRDLRFAWSAAC
jgi:S-adenosylmethionine:tRNA ribosyltransferase-isomerase